MAATCGYCNREILPGEQVRVVDVDGETETVHRACDIAAGAPSVTPQEALFGTQREAPFRS